MAKAATAYVEIVPDVSDFAEKLRADLERVNAKAFEVEINPNFEGFTQDVRDTLANNQQDLAIPVEPDFEGIHEKIRVAIEEHKPYPKITLNVDLDSKLIETALARLATGQAGKGAARAGKKVAETFAGAIANSLVKNMAKVGDGLFGVLMNPFVAPFVLAAIALALEFALAFTGGLVAAFAGAGFVGLAGFLLKGEPEVKAAASRLGKAFTVTWKAAAAPAMGGILTALDTVTEHVVNAGHQAGQIFDAIAGPIVGLGRSIGAAIDDIMNALSLRTSGIAAGVAGLGDLVEEVGKSIAQAFDVMLADPEALRQSLNDLAITIGAVIKAIGVLVGLGVHLENFARTWFRNVGDMNDVTAAFLAQGKSGGAKSLLQLWDDWTGKTDAQRIAAEKAQQANEELMDAITARARTANPTATLDQISEAIAKVSIGFKGGAQNTAEFSAAVSTELRKMQLAVEATNWQKFGQDAAAGFTAVDAATKATRKEVDKLIDSLTILNDRFIEKTSARINFKQDLIAIAKAAKDGSKGLGENTEAGLKNQEMVIGATEDLKKFILSSLQNGDSMERVASNVKGLSDNLVTQVAKFAGSNSAARTYLASLGALPEQILTKLALEGVPGAQEALDNLTKARTVEIKPKLAKDAFDGIFTDRDPELKNAGAQVGAKAAEGLGAALVTKLTASDPKMKAAGVQAAVSFATGVSDGGSKVTAASSLLVQQLGDGLSRSFSSAYDAGQMAAFGLVSGLQSESGYVWSAVHGFVENNVNAAIANALKTKSPSKVTFGYGQNAALGLAFGIDDKAHVVKASAKNLYRQIGRPPTASAAGLAGGSAVPMINARIYVGDREITDIVKTETAYADQRNARALYYGRRVG